MLITSGVLADNALDGRVAVVTGAGGGIGIEAAGSLLAIGANVVIAEIDAQRGSAAEAALSAAFRPGRACFVHTDVAGEASVAQLAEQACRTFGQVDIVINNATIAPLGAVHETPISAWDRSFGVNLRGPVLLARAFLPGMIARGYGVFACVSSLGTAFMGPYETFKAAQVHLAQTLADELEGTGVITFSIGPGFVPTATALNAVPLLAAKMGIAMDDLNETLKAQTISVEAAGAGFAAAVAMAERYHGQEISSTQALIDAGIEIRDESDGGHAPSDDLDLNAIAAQTGRVRRTLAEQADGWRERSFFERQWLVRMFKQQAGRPVEGWLDALAGLESAARTGDAAAVAGSPLPLDKLAAYYDHLAKAAEGYVREAAEREKQVAIVRGWKREVVDLTRLMG